MSTNTWVFSLPRIVLFGNPLKAKKVDGSARGGGGGKQARTQMCRNQRSKPAFPFYRGKNCHSSWVIGFCCSVHGSTKLRTPFFSSLALVLFRTLFCLPLALFWKKVIPVGT